MAVSATALKTTPKKPRVYVWQARTKAGEVKRGEMEALDGSTVETRIRALGLAPIKVKKKSGEFRFPKLGSGVSGKDLLIFTKQFATMIDAGLPLVQCLDILGTQMDNASLRKVVFAIKSRVESGSTFADALKDHPKVFDELFVQLCAAGEVGGILDSILNRLATYREKAEKLKRKVKGAMVYPVIVICVAIGVTALLLLKVTPVFAKMFSDFGQALPGPTQLVIDLSEWLQKWFIWMVLGITAGVIAFGFFYRSNFG